MIPRSAQSSLSHCTITRSFMVAGSRGTTSSRRPCATTIPPECWPRCRGRSWISSKSRAKRPMRRSSRSRPARSRRLSQRVVRVHELEAPHVLGEAVDLVLGDAEHLADLARGAAVAVGDDVRGHGRPRRPVALVDVLDDALPAVPARQVEVDVRPLPPLLGEEALEEQLHPHRVDRRDAEAVADRAVGGGPPALDQDVLAPAEVHEVPDDEEVAGQVQLSDESELALDLAPCLLVVGPVALSGPRLGGLAEEGELRLPLRHGVVGEAVAEVLERERCPLRERLGVPQEVGPVGEESGHRRRRLEVPLGVLGQEATGGGERPLLADAGEHVEERPALRARVAHPVGGDRLQAESVGQVEERLVRGLLLATAVPLHVEHHAAGAEGLDEAGQPIGVQHGSAPRRPSGRPGQRLDARQGHQPLDEAVQHPEVEPSLPLRDAGLHPRDQPAEIPVAPLRLDEERQRAPVREAQRGADDRPQARGAGGLEEARGAGDAVAVHQGDGAVAEPGGPLHEVLGKRRGAQEGEGRGGVELDGHDEVSPFLRLCFRRPRATSRHAGPRHSEELRQGSVLPRSFVSPGDEESAVPPVLRLRIPRDPSHRSPSE